MKVVSGASSGAAASTHKRSVRTSGVSVRHANSSNSGGSGLSPVPPAPDALPAAAPRPDSSQAATNHGRILISKHGEPYAIARRLALPGPRVHLWRAHQRDYPWAHAFEAHPSRLGHHRSPSCSTCVSPPCGSRRARRAPSLRAGQRSSTSEAPKSSREGTSKAQSASRSKSLQGALTSSATRPARSSSTAKAANRSAMAKATARAPMACDARRPRTWSECSDIGADWLSRRRCPNDHSRSRTYRTSCVSGPMWPKPGLDELRKEFGSSIELEYRFIPIFGATQNRIAEGWKDRGGYAGFGEHVRKVAEGFPHVSVNERVWSEVAPTTSSTAHEMLCAARLLVDEGVIDSAATTTSADAPSSRRRRGRFDRRSSSTRATSPIATCCSMCSVRSDSPPPRSKRS